MYSKWNFECVCVSVYVTTDHHFSNMPKKCIFVYWLRVYLEFCLKPHSQHFASISYSAHFAPTDSQKHLHMHFKSNWFIVDADSAFGNCMHRFRSHGFLCEVALHFCEWIIILVKSHLLGDFHLLYFYSIYLLVIFTFKWLSMNIYTTRTTRTAAINLYPLEKYHLFLFVCEIMLIVFPIFPVIFVIDDGDNVFVINKWEKSNKKPTKQLDKNAIITILCCLFLFACSASILF